MITAFIDFLKWLYKEVPILVVSILLSGFVLFLMVAGFSELSDRDDSDAKDGTRSRMTLLIDHGTGCEYLSYQGITPRLDASGKHVCKLRDQIQ